ncbi:hypothetical protein [Consotaella salsifontis]|uniref:Antifreeze protein n=1 Tax=Consotaella salsifontis TaxID=1365950 RepID=A0A1T4PS01_9HYPH|nr:hypothetical protein [Consotaella salsifontis]SJZ93967.1 hypothetical protein SAMN05428963_104113 [Consotaella salsifontis]
MLKTLARAACVVAALAAGATTLAAAPAAAAERHGSASITITTDRGADLRLAEWGRGGPRHDGRRYQRGTCSPRDALFKAGRMGFNRAHVADVGRRSVTVAGRRWGHHSRVTFARVPGCPVVRMR